MRKSSLLSLALASLAAAATLRRRQTGLFEGLPGSPPPFVKATKIETLKPTFPGADVKRVKMTYGPYKLRAFNDTKRIGNYISQDPHGTSWMSKASDFPTDITILNVHMTTHFKDGTEIGNANGVYNHHVFAVDTTRVPTAHIGCADSPVEIMPINSIMGNSAEAMSELASGGVNPTTRPDTGNYVGKDHTITFQLDLVNYNNKPEEVFVSLDMSYVNGKESGIWEIAQHLIPVGLCAAATGKDAGIDALIPPTDKRKWTIEDNQYIMRDNGKLIYVRGHMHDGSVNMVFSLNGKQICDSRTEYKAPAVGEISQAGAAKGMMSGISICMNGTEYKKGDKLTIAASYDLDKHPLRVHPEGDMGSMSETMALGVIVTGTKI